MIGPLELLVTVLAVARVTRFVVADNLTEPLRTWVVGRFGEESKLAYLVNCFWCTSIWVGAPIAGVAFLFQHWVTYMLLTWLAASQVTGLLGQLDRG